MDGLRAYVTATDDGDIVLVDPDAVAIMQAFEEPRREAIFEQGRARIDHFVQRMKETNKDPASWTIVLIEVDDPTSGVLANALMPGANWDQYRARGEQPFARGIAPRRAIEAYLKVCAPNAHAEMVRQPEEMLAVVIAGHGGASIYNLQKAQDVVHAS